MTRNRHTKLALVIAVALVGAGMVGSALAQSAENKPTTDATVDRSNDAE